jgi:deoxyribodipyrimidine photolyase-related protein
MSTRTVRLILGDQLNSGHSWFSAVDPDVLYVMMEVRQETDYVRHHIQKVVAIFMAMRAFAQQLRSQGHQVHYISLDDPQNKQRINENILAVLSAHKADKFEYQEPDEYRLDQELSIFCKSLSIASTCCSTEHFFTTRNALADFFKGKKTFLMESFYRNMRKQTGILMQDDQPEGEKWNYDHDNRHTFSAVLPPPVKEFEHDASEIVELLKTHQVDTIGKIENNVNIWPVNRTEALAVLIHFVTELLPSFGTYQDMMSTDHAYLYHSRLSFALNIKMITPHEVVDAALTQYRKQPETISLAQVEGFVRQILGWREYMRGIYWAAMPEFATHNYFNHHRKLPSWFWTGETKMNCLRHAIRQSLNLGYAHHIQRLMITGNFALLVGIHPDETDQWYLGIYIDAFEWVEITNTRGMSQYADGGIVGSKPYCSSGAYISKMSNYCKSCSYSVKEKTGAHACPFNSLYWHFHVRNRSTLERNPRIGMVYRTWDKMNADHQRLLLDQATQYLNTIESL